MEGPWIKAPKTPESTEKPETPTLMHDDEVAKGLGFQGGFVGGSTLMAVTNSAIFASFGHNWYEGGAYSVKFAKPVYTGDEIRVVWEESEPDPDDKRKITFWIEKRDGTQTTFGWAALGEAGRKLTPPWERKPISPAETASDLLPEMKVGDKYPDFDCCLSKEMFIPKLDQIEDYNWWYRIASPWGEPIVPPSELGIMAAVGVVQQMENATMEILPTAVWAGFEVVVYGPVFIGHNYHLQSWLYEKCKTARSTVFFTDELTVDDENGRRVAIIHNKNAILD